MLCAPRRPGFTLLEVLLALGISVLLMGALYVSMEVQLRYAQAGREKVDESSLARALLNRIASDVAASLTPIRASAGATSANSTTSSSTTASTTGSTGTSGSTSTSGTTSSTTTDATAALNAVTPFNSGVQGDVDRLTLFTARVPNNPRSDAELDSASNGTSDIRRITYWLAGDRGLARQDVTRVTADDDNTQLPPNVPDDGALVIAPEVANLEFHFFDGTNWSDTWDGTSIGSDGATPIGPPRAVKIIVGIRSPSGQVKNYVHVVAIQSANAQPTSTTTGESP